VTYMERATAVSQVEWRKSSRSSASGSDCIEVAEVADMVAVRDSKDPSGPAYLFGRQHWATFVQAVRNGAFDLG
jgi:Domain of unknown function (DUF397).